jgi:hypothetical protein
VSGNRQDEAFTEVQPGGVLNSENILVGGRPYPDKGKAIVMSNVSGESEMTPTESKTTGTVGNFPHGSRETPVPSVSPMEADRSAKARGHNPDTHDAGESHSSIVPGKPANKGGVALPAELAEGKGADQGEHRAIATGPDSTPELGRDTVRSQVAWIAGCT